MEKQIELLTPGEKVEHIFGSVLELKEAYVLGMGGGLQLRLSLTPPAVDSGTAIDYDRFNFYLATKDGAVVPVTYSEAYLKDGKGFFHIMTQIFDEDFKEDLLIIRYEGQKELTPSIVEIKNFPNPWYKGRGCQ